MIKGLRYLENHAFRRVSLDYGFEFKLLPFPNFLELRGPVFILECPIYLDYEEVISRESEQVIIFVKWHNFS